MSGSEQSGVLFEATVDGEFDDSTESLWALFQGDVAGAVPMMGELDGQLVPGYPNHIDGTWEGEAPMAEGLGDGTWTVSLSSGR